MRPDDSGAGLLPLVVFPLFFPALWVTVLLIVSRIGGWSTLARHHRLEEPFEGERWRFRSGYLGWTRYSGVLIVGANSRGMHLAVLLPWRVGHPPLLIPWSDIASATPIRRWFVPSLVEFRFKSAPGVTLRLPRDLADDLARASRGRLSLGGHAD